MIIVYEYGIEIDETYMLNKEFEELVLEEERAARITFNFLVIIMFMLRMVTY